MRIDVFPCKELKVGFVNSRRAVFFQNKIGCCVALLILAIVLRQVHVSNGQHDLCHDEVGDDMIRKLSIYPLGCARLVGM